jgi:hypothetical protein
MMHSLLGIIFLERGIKKSARTGALFYAAWPSH